MDKEQTNWTSKSFVVVVAISENVNF